MNEEDTNTVNVAAKNKYNDKNNTRTTSQTVEDEYYHDSSDEEVQVLIGGKYFKY